MHCKNRIVFGIIFLAYAIQSICISMPIYKTKGFQHIAIPLAIGFVLDNYAAHRRQKKQVAEKPCSRKNPFITTSRILLDVTFGRALCLMRNSAKLCGTFAKEDHKQFKQLFNEVKFTYLALATSVAWYSINLIRNLQYRTDLNTQEIKKTQSLPGLNDTGGNKRKIHRDSDDDSGNTNCLRAKIEDLSHKIDGFYGEMGVAVDHLKTQVDGLTKKIDSLKSRFTNLHEADNLSRALHAQLLPETPLDKDHAASKNSVQAYDSKSNGMQNRTPKCHIP